MSSHDGRCFECQVGTPEGEEHQEMGSGFVGETVSDFDIDYSKAAKKAERPSKASTHLRNKRKVKEAAEKLELNIMVSTDLFYFHGPSLTVSSPSWDSTEPAQRGQTTFGSRFGLLHS